MKASEIRQLTAEELNTKMTDIKAELFKKDISRVKTVIRANELSKENA